MQVLVKKGLLNNTSVVALDARCNPGLTPKIRNQMSLTLLKNIEILRAKGIKVDKEYQQVPELYSYQVPPAILKRLALKNTIDSE